MVGLAKHVCSVLRLLPTTQDLRTRVNQQDVLENLTLPHVDEKLGCYVERYDEPANER